MGQISNNRTFLSIFSFKKHAFAAFLIAAIVISPSCGENVEPPVAEAQLEPLDVNAVSTSIHDDTQRPVNWSMMWQLAFGDELEIFAQVRQVLKPNTILNISGDIKATPKQGASSTTESLENMLDMLDLHIVIEELPTIVKDMGSLLDEDFYFDLTFKIPISTPPKQLTLELWIADELIDSAIIEISNGAPIIGTGIFNSGISK
jgi:hypothetical protein